MICFALRDTVILCSSSSLDFVFVAVVEWLWRRVKSTVLLRVFSDFLESSIPDYVPKLL